MIQSTKRTQKVGATVAAALAVLAIGASLAPGHDGKTVAVVGSFDHSSCCKTIKHPRSFKVHSADSAVRFHDLHWRRWGAHKAVARGKATTCDYTRRCETSKTKLVATHPKRCGAIAEYKKMTASHIPMYGNGPFSLPVYFDCTNG